MLSFLRLKQSVNLVEILLTGVSFLFAFIVGGLGRGAEYYWWSGTLATVL